jgi:hypothetical protein
MAVQFLNVPLLQQDHLQLGCATVSDDPPGCQRLLLDVAGARVSKKAVDKDVQRAGDPVGAGAEGNCGSSSLQGLRPPPLPAGTSTSCCRVLLSVCRGRHQAPTAASCMSITTSVS